MFHHIRSCDKTGNVDILFSMYEDYRNNIINLLQNDPELLIEKIWTFDSPITIDRDCKCKMGRGINSTDFICSHCYNIKRMTKFSKDIVDSPFIIGYGKKTGEKIIIVKYNITDLYLHVDKLPLIKSKSLSNDFRLCSPMYSKINKYVIGDSFTINTLMSVYFQKYFGNDSHFTSYIYTSFVCANDGYCIYKVPNIGTMNSLLLRPEYFYMKDGEKAILPNVIRGIVVQLIMILMELRKFNFSHGMPNVSSLLFSDKQVTGSYEGINIDSPVSIQFSNLTKTSATINGVHYFSKSIIDDINFENFIFTPNIDNGCNTRKFKINSSNTSMQSTLNSLGFPIYIGTYDFYMFMMSLMSYPEIANGFNGEQHLSSIWSCMWGDHQEQVEKELLGKVPLKKVLRDKWLKCDILDQVCKIMKN